MISVLYFPLSTVSKDVTLLQFLLFDMWYVGSLHSQNVKEICDQFVGKRNFGKNTFMTTIFLLLFVLGICNFKKSVPKE